MKQAALKKIRVAVAVLLLGSCSGTRPYYDGVYTGRIKSPSLYGWSPELTIVVKQHRLIAVNFDYLADPGVYPNCQEIKKQVRDLGKVNPEFIYYALIKQLLDKQVDRLNVPAGAVRITEHFKRLAEVLLARAHRGEADPVVLEEPLSSCTIPKTITNNSESKTVPVPAGSLSRTEQPPFGPLAVVSGHQLASRTGMAVLETGGSAADAAFTMAAVLTVAEPWLSGILGGGIRVLYYDQATKRVFALNATGSAGSKTGPESINRLKNRQTPGMHQAVVPGAWAGWMTLLKRFGIRSLTELLQPALHYAEEGIPASAELVCWLKKKEEVIRRWPDTATIYLPHGRTPRTGEILCQKQLAETFRELLRIYETACVYGEKEAFDTVNDYVYRGLFAKKMVHYMERKGGLLSESDFTNFYAGFSEPVSIDYKGLQVFRNPSDKQGIHMLLGLNILKGCDFAGLREDSSVLIHLLAETAKLVRTDESNKMDANDFSQSVAYLLSDTYAAQLRARIDPDKTLVWPGNRSEQPEELSENAMQTTTFSVVDRYGNAATVTASLGDTFFVIGDTGIIINNLLSTMDNKNSSNAGGPYLALLKGKPYLLGGSSGGDIQPQEEMQQFIYVMEFGLAPQEAVSRPRFAVQAFPDSALRWYKQRTHNALAMETGLPWTVRKELIKRGHAIINGQAMGFANMLVIKPDNGEILTGADPRFSTSLGIVK